jgi:hypothetical protein
MTVRGAAGVGHRGRRNLHATPDDRLDAGS